MDTEASAGSNWDTEIVKAKTKISTQERADTKLMVIITF
jgi:hypothetical protein